MIPIGPAPVINTSSPSTGKDSAVCTALPKGSKIAAISFAHIRAVLPDVGHRQCNVFGECARPIHADTLTVEGRKDAFVQRDTATPANHVAFSAYDVAQRKKSFTFDPTSTTSPTNS